MSLLSSLTQIASKAGYKIDSAIIGSTDITTKQLLAFSQDVIREMCEEHPWPKLFKRGTVTTVASQATYALPADFSHYHYDTWWNQSNSWRMYGPLTPQEYAEIDGYGISALIEDAFQLRGITDSELTIVPTPSASGETLLFEYASKRYVRPRTWAAGQVVAAGDYTFYNGVYYTADNAGTTAGSSPAADSGVTWSTYSGAYETFIADTDEPILSAKVFEYGVYERFAEQKEIAFQPRYRDELDREFNKTNPGRVLRADANIPAQYQFGNNGRVVFGSSR